MSSISWICNLSWPKVRKFLNAQDLGFRFDWQDRNLMIQDKTGWQFIPMPCVIVVDENNEVSWFTK